MANVWKWTGDLEIGGTTNVLTINGNPVFPQGYLTVDVTTLTGTSPTWSLSTAQKNSYNIYEFTGTPASAQSTGGTTSSSNGTNATITSIPNNFQVGQQVRISFSEIWTVTGSVSSGVFTPGEQVVQNVTGSSATLIGTVTGANPMFLQGPFGTAQPNDTDDWVGQTSAATYTPSGAAAQPTNFDGLWTLVAGTNSTTLVFDITGSPLNTIVIPTNIDNSIASTLFPQRVNINIGSAMRGMFVVKNSTSDTPTPTTLRIKSGVGTFVDVFPNETAALWSDGLGNVNYVSAVSAAPQSVIVANGTTVFGVDATGAVTISPTVGDSLTINSEPAGGGTQNLLTINTTNVTPVGATWQVLSVNQYGETTILAGPGGGLPTLTVVGDPDSNPIQEWKIFGGGSDVRGRIANDGSMFIGPSNHIPSAGIGLTVNGTGTNHIQDWYSSNEGFVDAFMAFNGILNAQGGLFNNVINNSPTMIVYALGTVQNKAAQQWGTHTPHQVITDDINAFGGLSIYPVSGSVGLSVTGDAVFNDIARFDNTGKHTAPLTQATPSGPNTTYAGTFSPTAVPGDPVEIEGFTNNNNNGFYTVVSCSGVSLVANNPNGAAETNPAIAIYRDSVNNAAITATAITTVTGAQVLTVTCVNIFKVGERVLLTGTAESFLNGQTVQVLPTGLSGTQFEAYFNHANYSNGADTGTALGTLGVGIDAYGSVSIVQAIVPSGQARAALTVTPDAGPAKPDSISVFSGQVGFPFRQTFKVDNVGCTFITPDNVGTNGALTIVGDTSNNDVLDMFTTGGVSPGIAISQYGDARGLGVNLQDALNNQTFMQPGYVNITGYTTGAVNITPTLGVLAMSITATPLVINMGTGTGVALEIQGDNFTNNILELSSFGVVTPGVVVDAEGAMFLQNASPFTNGVSVNPSPSGDDYNFASFITLVADTPNASFAQVDTSLTLNAASPSANVWMGYNQDIVVQGGQVYSGTITGINQSVVSNSTGTGMVTSLQGQHIQVQTAGTGSVPDGDLSGIFANVIGNSTAGQAALIGFDAAMSIETNCTDVFGFHAETGGGVGNASNVYGYWVKHPVPVTGTWSHVYGLYIEDQTTGGGLNPDPWAIFVAGGVSSFKGIATNIVTKTTTYTATQNDHTINCDATGGAFTLTLPTTVIKVGQEYYIKKIDSSANAITVSSSVNIDGSLTQSLSTQYASITVQWDGTQWWIY